MGLLVSVGAMSSNKCSPCLQLWVSRTLSLVPGQCFSGHPKDPKLSSPLMLGACQVWSGATDLLMSSYNRPIARLERWTSANVPTMWFNLNPCTPSKAGAFQPSCFSRPGFAVSRVTLLGCRKRFRARDQCGSAGPAMNATLRRHKWRYPQ